MDNMHSTFSKDSLKFADFHNPRPRPAKRDIATLYSTDISYQLRKGILIARNESKSDEVISVSMKFHQNSR